MGSASSVGNGFFLAYQPTRCFHRRWVSRKNFITQPPYLIAPTRRILCIQSNVLVRVITINEKAFFILPPPLSSLIALGDDGKLRSAEYEWSFRFYYASFLPVIHDVECGARNVSYVPHSQHVNTRTPLVVVDPLIHAVFM